MQRRGFLAAAAGAAMTGWAGRSLAADAPSTTDLAGDVAILREALRLHPGLYRYNSPAQFEGRLQRFGAEYTAAPDMAGRYLALTRLTAAIRCGHSYGNFFNQRKAVANALFDRPTRLPLHFVWLGREMVVTDDPSGQIARGSVVTNINGRQPAAMRDALLPLIRADGHNDLKRISLLEVRGDDSIETFDVFQGLVFPPADGLHRLTLRATDGAERRLVLPAIGLAARQAQMAPESASKDAPRWQWAVRPDGVAVLTMPGWALWGSKWDWKA